MGKVRPLIGMIYSKYDTQAQLARKMGWDRRRLNRITNGAKEPDLSEAAELAKMLDVPIERIADIFLSEKSPNG